jgi:hypothetical protein
VNSRSAFVVVQRLAPRVRIVLLAVDGLSNTAITERLWMPRQTAIGGGSEN